MHIPIPTRSSKRAHKARTTPPVAPPTKSGIVPVATPRRLSTEATGIRTPRLVSTAPKPSYVASARTTPVAPTPAKQTQSFNIADLLSPIATKTPESFFNRHSQVKSLQPMAPTITTTPKATRKRLGGTKGTTKQTPHASAKLMAKWKAGLKPTNAEQDEHAALIQYNKMHRGIDTAKSEPMNGEPVQLHQLSMLYEEFCNTVTMSTAGTPLWKQKLPTRSELHREGRFGRPSKNHSFTQEGCFETCLFPLLTSGYLNFYDFMCLCGTHILIPHMVKMIIKCHTYDFTWITYEDPFWKQQTIVPQSHAMAMLAALFFYRMHAPDVMRLLGGSYTGEHRDISTIVACLTSHDIDPWLITQYVRATTVGCPNHFVAETSRENALLHWRKGNHPSVKKEIVDVLNTMAKEHRNRFNMPLPNYMARFMPNVFFTPQHALTKADNAMRLIFDAAKRYTAASTPINMMTSTRHGTEMACLYGDTFVSLLERIWDLRISYPSQDIVTHANDVKSCFKQMKLHPDIMPAFSIMVADFLYLQSALPFGTDFSPQNWEPVRRLVEVLAEKLFPDTSLRTKHRRYLARLQWEPSLGKSKAPFVPAKACSQRTGVLDKDGNPVPTPQRLFVDDSVYAEVYEADRVRIEQTIAAGIEAIFILLGHSDLSKRQDPVSFDKMEAMLVSYLNKILGKLIHTRRLDVGVPQVYVDKTLRLLRPFHHKRKSFTVKEMERITGMLVFIASTAPWMKFLLSQCYASVTAAIGHNTAHLNRTDKQFREFLREARATDAATQASTFAQSETAKQIHSCMKKHWINRTLREELHIIIAALRSRRLNLRTPIAHLVRRDPSAIAWSDSCLYAAGGYSTTMRFWWYIEWPEEVRKHTLIYIRNNKDGKLISINVLEYAAILINYAAAYHYYHNNHDPSDPYPMVLFYADNTASEAWMEKACNSSLIGRALSRLQCAMMINNNVGLHTGHITTTNNVISDRISRIKRETNSMRGFQSILQDYPELAGCKRFRPSAALISHLMDAISQKKFIDPMEVNASILRNPGQTTS